MVHGLHAVPAGSEPGHSAAHLRISDGDLRCHRSGSLQRQSLRRRNFHCRGRADGRPRAEKTQYHPHQPGPASSLPGSALHQHHAPRGSQARHCRPERRRHRPGRPQGEAECRCGLRPGGLPQFPGLHRGSQGHCRTDQGGWRSAGLRHPGGHGLRLAGSPRQGRCRYRLRRGHVLWQQAELGRSLPGLHRREGRAQA